MNALEKWHSMVLSQEMEDLPTILAEDCVFYSPVVHTPQRGRDITLMYLAGAAHVLKDGFRYVKEVVTENQAVFEFECMVGETLVNGIDMITLGDDGKIVEFKVMIRPLQAIKAVHSQMGAMLAQLKGSAAP